MKSTVGVKVALCVAALIALALSVNALVTPAMGQTQAAADKAYLKGSLTGVAPGTEMPIKVDLTAEESWTASPDKEYYTVDPSVQYSDLTTKFKQLRVKGHILIEGKVRAERR